MEIEFATVEELFQRVLPALRTKRRSLAKEKRKEIREEDIWNYLRKSKWSKAKQLTLADMVDDILNLDEALLDSYIREEWAKQNALEII